MGVVADDVDFPDFTLVRLLGTDNVDFQCLEVSLVVGTVDRTTRVVVSAVASLVA